ncbi:MAG: anti-sigma factor [Acidobacteria bacterium]|nr:anti-sigma factor [Acidobacteriota bacterium]
MHADPELLALIAMGEQISDVDVLDHLAGCPDCRVELAHLSHAATLGRSTLGAGELFTPNARVWARVTEELGIASEAPTETPIIALRGRARRRRRWIPVVVAASVATMLVVGGLASWQLLQPTAARVLASAKLSAFPEWKGSTGEARVEKSADGTLVVQVSLSSPEHGSGFDEVWLMTSDAKHLVSLGVLRDGSGTFSIPAGINLSQYDVVDISSEPLDGNPAHSSNSIVRGQLS